MTTSTATPLALNVSYDYNTAIQNSIKVAWKLEDVFPKTTKLNFSRPHLPDALTGIAELNCLGAEEKLALNHLRGNSYMNLYNFVEEYIIAQVVEHTQAEMFGDHDAIWALLRFSEEEVKHQALFRLYCAAFDRDCGTRGQVLNNAAQVAGIIMSKSSIAVMLVTLHLSQ